MINNKPILEIENLKVSFNTPKGIVEAVRGISFSLGKERLGIVGESGSGKSQTGRAVLGLTAGNGTISADKMLFQKENLNGLSSRKWRKIRGARISMIMQDPKYSLNPVMTVGQQIMEGYLEHYNVSRDEARQRTFDMLEKVKIRNPKSVFNLYPHEVSGGMGQRIMIAMMLIPEPELIIADEPTSALDVTVQLQILSILDELVKEQGMALIFISHDLTLVSSFCDRVLVMYQGKILEEIKASDLANAKHAYTRGLLNCLPIFERRGQELPILKRDLAWEE